MATHDRDAGRARYEIRFLSLFHGGRGLSFPCDADGRVSLDELSESARRSFQRAQERVGLDFATPAVMLAGNAG